MKIKRFFASDMRQAIRQVRQHLGADAVILSNKSVEGGVEIVAARDYDERVVQQAVEEQAAEKQAQVRHEQQSLAEAASSQVRPARAESNERPVVPTTGVRQTATKPVGPSMQWQQDPIMREMKNEIRQLRQDFHTQLSELTWADQARENPIRMDVVRRFLDAGFSRQLSIKLAEPATAETRLEHAWMRCLDQAAAALPVVDDPLLEQGGVVSLIGPTGVGKTTTIAKLAARFRMRHGADSLALITTDNFRIGAHEQLSNFARILGVPMRVASTQQELAQVLHEFSDKRLVLIDSAGMSQRDLRLTQQFDLLTQESLCIDNYLVLSATTEASALQAVIRSFSPVQLKACIVTKLDEIECPGSVLSTVIQHQLPLSFITDGQRVPEDIHLARPASLMGRFSQAADQAQENLPLSVLLGDSNSHAIV